MCDERRSRATDYKDDTYDETANERLVNAIKSWRDLPAEHRRHIIAGLMEWIAIGPPPFGAAFANAARLLEEAANK